MRTVRGRRRCLAWMVTVGLLIVVATGGAARAGVGAQESPAVDISPAGEQPPSAQDQRGVGNPLADGGTLVIVGGGGLPDEVRREFVRLAGETNARLLVIPTASAHAGDEDAEQYYLEDWRPFGMKDLRLHHARDREQASSEEFLAPFASATAVWFSGGDQSVLAERFLDTPVEAALAGLLRRGGVIGGTSAGAAIQTRVMIAGGREQPEMARGFDLLPGGIADQHFLARNRQNRLRAAVRANPGCTGWGIDESTALIADREGLRVMGASSVTMIRAARTEGEFLERTLTAGERLGWAEVRAEGTREQVPADGG